MTPVYVKNNSKPLTPAPEGLHQAVCVDVVSLGVVKTAFGDKEQVELRWELDITNEDADPPRPFMVIQRYTASLNEKAKLRAHLEAWRGRKFNKEELEGFDLENLLGINAQVQVVHNLSDDGRVWANVQAVVPLGKGMGKIAPSAEYVRVCDRPASGNGTSPAATTTDDDDLPF